MPKFYNISKPLSRIRHLIKVYKDLYEFNVHDFSTFMETSITDLFFVDLYSSINANCCENTLSYTAEIDNQELIKIMSQIIFFRKGFGNNYIELGAVDMFTNVDKMPNIVLGSQSNWLELNDNLEIYFDVEDVKSKLTN